MITNLADFYRSKAWEAFIRLLAAERADESGVIWCAHCGKPIIYKYDRIAHHCNTFLTLANVNDAAIALNPENIAFVHHRCHNEIHERFGFGKPNAAPRIKKVYLIHGSPCSGKSTYAASVAGPGDIILDLDSIWGCISAQGTDGHFCRDERLRHNVFRLRDCMLDMIKTRYGEWNNAYIIGGYPRIMERERMISLYGAELIHIDTPQEICLQRAEQRPKEWAGYVKDYWEAFQAS